MNFVKPLLFAAVLLLSATAHAEKIKIAAAADLRFAMDEIVATFAKANPADQVEVSYGSSGMFLAQIQQGAPFDLFFSADIAFPRELAAKGFAGSVVKPYAMGRIVLWSVGLDATKMTLASLADPKIARIAIANPLHAPYGKRAEEALRAASLWEKLQPKLVFAENISQAAQYVQSGNAQVGIIALALAASPQLVSQGGYWLVPDKLHQPLEQGFVVTKRAEKSTLAKRFAEFVTSKEASLVMIRFGFAAPAEATAK